MQEGVSAMGYHLRLKLPGNICEPQLGSHTNWQNYSGKRRRKAERNKLPFFHDFKALTTIVEFCSSQLLLDLSPTLTELVRKEKISSLKITTTKQNKKTLSGEQWETSTEEVKRKLALLLPWWCLQHPCAQPSFTAVLHKQPSYFGGFCLSKEVKHACHKRHDYFHNKTTTTFLSYLHNTQIYIIISELMHTDCAQIHTPPLFLFFSS